MRRVVLYALLALLLGSCGMFTPTVTGTGTVAEPSTYTMIIEVVRIIPESLRAIGSLVGAIVGGMVVLSFAFRSTRKAMALCINAVFSAITYRVREWRDRQRPKDLMPPDEPLAKPDDKEVN